MLLGFHYSIGEYWTDHDIYRSPTDRFHNIFFFILSFYRNHNK